MKVKKSDIGRMWMWYKRGFSNKEIADILGFGYSTVHDHLFLKKAQEKQNYKLDVEITKSVER